MYKITGCITSPAGRHSIACCLQLDDLEISTRRRWAFIKKHIYLQKKYRNVLYFATRENSSIVATYDVILPVERTVTDHTLRQQTEIFQSSDKNLLGLKSQQRKGIQLVIRVMILRQ